MYHPLSITTVISGIELIVICFYIMLRGMPLTEDIVTSRYRISGYRDDAVIINETSHTNSLIVSADTLLSSWSVESISDLGAESLEPLFELAPEVVLLGTGTRQRFPEPRILGLFGQKGIGLEVMDNGALCRTFNILVAEDRAVVAAILFGD